MSDRLLSVQARLLRLIDRRELDPLTWHLAATELVDELCDIQRELTTLEEERRRRSARSRAARRRWRKRRAT